MRNQGAVSAGGRALLERRDRFGLGRDRGRSALPVRTMRVAGTTPIPDAELEVGVCSPSEGEPRFAVVVDGYFVLGHVPYGMRLIRERQRSARINKWVSRARLERGDQQEVRIVRLIFELYACQRMPLNHILNSLRAEGVPVRANSTAWTVPRLERIIDDPSYIGASRFKGVVRYGAFEPIVEPWIFFAAQSRRHFEKLSKSGSVIQQRDLVHDEGECDE